MFAQADDGADTAGGLPDDNHQDNANLDTRPDGTPGLMQMYLFEPIPIAPGVQIPFASVNGSDDPQIVYHEYTHGLSNRLITDAQGYGAVAGVQSGAMGEAWSDWYALDFLARRGFQRDDPAPGDVKEGEYVDNGQNLIRTEPMDCPPDAPGIDACPGFAETGPGGYTYQDFGLIVARRAGRRPPPRAPRRRRDLGRRRCGSCASAWWPATGRPAAPTGPSATSPAACGSGRPSRRSWTSATRSCRRRCSPAGPTPA